MIIEYINIDDQLVSSIENWIYETKCRRCGKISRWFFASRENMDYLAFKTVMTDFIVSPRQFICNGCGKKGVHDIISFNE
jgi:ribosomal protein L37E